MSFFSFDNYLAVSDFSAITLAFRLLAVFSYVSRFMTNVAYDWLYVLVFHI